MLIGWFFHSHQFLTGLVDNGVVLIRWLLRPSLQLGLRPLLISSLWSLLHLRCSLRLVSQYPMSCGQLDREFKMSVPIVEIVASNEVDHISLGYFQFLYDSGYIHDLSDCLHRPVLMPRQESSNKIAPTDLGFFQGSRKRLVSFFGLEKKLFGCIHPKKSLIDGMADDP